MTDSQLSPGLSSPQSCPQGCARWDNLAADGNTTNQNDANAKWAGGSPPQGAGNSCAQPANDPKTSPWCYCAGKNDNSMGFCQDRNASAAVCKSTPNGLNTLNGQISDCTSTIEFNRNNNFASNTFKLQKDIESLSGIVGDSMVMGDSVFGKFSYGDITNQVKERNAELKSKKDKLVKNVDKSEAIIERSDRDFSDVKNTMPQPYPKRVLNFVEDYTLAFLSISYLFMIISLIYVYTAMSETKITGFAKAFTGSVLLTMLLFILLIYLA
jgi:uncharacterized membrane protein YhdT